MTRARHTLDLEIPTHCEVACRGSKSYARKNEEKENVGEVAGVPGEDFEPPEPLFGRAPCVPHERIKKEECNNSRENAGHDARDKKRSADVGVRRAHKTHHANLVARSVDRKTDCCKSNDDRGKRKNKN